MTVNAGIIDDEPRSRELLLFLIKQYCPTIRVKFDCATLEEARDEVLKQKPDLVFLDIQLAESFGFELLSSRTSQYFFEVVFTTAYSQYAVEAFQADVAGYLLKPISPEQLVKVVSKVTEKLAARQELEKAKAAMLNTVSSPMEHQIGIPTLSGIVMVEPDRLMRCEADGNYTNLFFEDGEKMVVSKTLKEFEGILPANAFCRVHKSHIVSIKRIRFFYRGDNSSLTLADGAIVPVSATQRQSLETRLKIM